MVRPVLVTGAGGFIGRHVVASLRADGVPVRALVRRESAAKSLLAPGVELVVGDVLDAVVIRRAMSGIGAVFHLAGRLFSPGEPAQEYEELHVGATAALLNHATRGASLEFFLFCSTTGVHGDTGARLPREDDPGRPENEYEASKQRAEALTLQIAREHGLKAVIARPGLVYGPGDKHLLGWFRSIQNGYYRVIGSGANRFHPIYIDDLVRGLRLAAAAATAECRAYHLVGSRPVSMLELSEAIALAVGRPLPGMHLPRPVALLTGMALELLPVSRRWLPLTRSRVRFMTQNRAYDDTRARTELGFTPTVDLAEGLRRTVAWYRENGLL